jgi:hypothetical protein
MAPESEKPVCPHCGLPLRAFSLPDNTGWEGEYQLACFNDDCDYFRRGWVWIFDHYGVKASYRYRIDPVSGHASPLAVWSKAALRDRLLEEGETRKPEKGPQAASSGPASGSQPGERTATAAEEASRLEGERASIPGNQGPESVSDTEGQGGEGI